jgi:hypothetical protein
MKFNRQRYFDSIRSSLFGGSLSQQQVDGQNILLSAWEKGPGVVNDDLRHLAYCLATTKHETAHTMWPITEYGKGEGHDYGVPDPQTKQTYYGRGFVMITWRENYAHATEQLDLVGEDDLEWHADRALAPEIAAQILYQGCLMGWFRSGHSLPRYFSSTVDDPVGAREIVNGDKHYSAPKGASEATMGEYIANLHQHFLAALQAAVAKEPQPESIEVVVEYSIESSVPINITFRQVIP